MTENEEAIQKIVDPIDLKENSWKDGHRFGIFDGEHRYQATNKWIEEKKAKGEPVPVSAKY